LLRELTGETYASLVKPADDMPLDQRNLPTAGLVDQALEQNLDVIAGRLGVEVAKSDVKIAQSGHMPTLDLFAQRTENDREADQVNTRIDRSGDPNNPPPVPVAGVADSNRTDDVIGVQVNIPIFAGGGTQSRVRQQVYLHRAAREKLEVPCVAPNARRATPTSA